MAQPTNIYVDPQSGNDTTGDGSVGTPWKTVQFALDNTTRDATDGDRFNVKAGSADVLSSKLSVATYGSSTGAAPLIFQGYTSVALDGGKGDIDGGGTSVFVETGKDSVHVIDMVMHNCGNQQVFRGRFDLLLLRSEFHTTTTTLQIIQGNTRSSAIDCYVHSFTGGGINIANGMVAYCFVDKSVTGNAAAAISSSAQGTIIHNIIKLSGSGNSALAIQVNGSGVFVYNNSIWSNAGTGEGIRISSANSGHIANNLIEGFSGTGGDGITSTGGGNGVIIYNNSVNDCETAFTLNHDEFSPFGGNETLSASPFTDVTVSTNDFTPADTGDVLKGYTAQFPGPTGTPASFAARGAAEPECVAASGGARYRGLVPGGGLGAC